MVEPIEPTNNDDDPQMANLLLIVVGAHLRAEVADRPLAYNLRRSVVQWLKTRHANLNILAAPIVCSDLWYVNQQSLQKHPTISVGGPGVNALSAYYSQKLTPVLVRDNQVAIQLDPEYIDLRVCLWGMNHQLTVEALRLFTDKYLEEYLRAVVTQVEPQEG